MHLKHVTIKNFRGLKQLSFDLPELAAVIVGPNAVGKSSVLEAIRLTRGVLAQTYNGETQQVLTSLGAIMPGFGTLKADALLGDVNKPLEITLKLELLTHEMQFLAQRIPQLARLRIQNLFANATNDDLALVNYLSSEEGQAQYQETLVEAEQIFRDVEQSKTIILSLVIDPIQQSMRGTNLFHQEVATLLSRGLPPSVGLMTYFPADRAMPTGEVNIQLGAADAQQQLHSHVGQPATKYQRLKQQIVNQTLTAERSELAGDFNTVFDKLLEGKKLESISLTPHGLLSVGIRETATGAIFDIDSMSSGEKGLLLSFFLMKRSTAQGGIILLDEPELHLNPAVCRKIVPFLLQEVLEPLNIQAIICTHSPDITAQAYENPKCTLLHLRSGVDMTPIYQRDKQEVFEALRRLGSQPSDVLFSHGSVYVEGDDDEELISIGWAERIVGYQLIKLHGRDRVEREIKTLQSEEAKDQLNTLQCFIFDLDRKPTNLNDSKFVKVRQWDRYCLENYLLGADAIFDACRSLMIGGSPSRGELSTTLQDLAMAQVRGVIAQQIYKDLEPENPGFRRKLKNLDDYEQIGQDLLKTLATIKEQVANLDSAVWLTNFKNQCESQDQLLREEWHENWKKHADGKSILTALYMKLNPKCSMTDFKRRIVQEMRNQKTEDWRLVDNILSSALNGH
jgi:predicted ATPase